MYTSINTSVYLAYLAALQFHLGAVTKQRLDDQWFAMFHSNVQRCIVILERKPWLY